MPLHMSRISTALVLRVRRVDAPVGLVVCLAIIRIAIIGSLRAGSG